MRKKYLHTESSSSKIWKETCLLVTSRFGFSYSLLFSTFQYLSITYTIGSSVIIELIFMDDYDCININ